MHTVISSACIPYILSWSFEPHRLRHIDLLFKIAMEKGGFHIELVKFQLIFLPAPAKSESTSAL